MIGAKNIIDIKYYIKCTVTLILKIIYLHEITREQKLSVIEINLINDLNDKNYSVAKIVKIEIDV